MVRKPTSIIIGGGSIGLRHADALTELGHEVVIVSARNDLSLRTFKTIAESVAATSAGYAVVANITSKHSDAVAELSDAGFTGKLLIEKPSQIGSISTAAFSKVAVAFNLRLHPAIEELRKLITGVEVYAVECYVGQHLSTWRAGRELEAQYSSHADQGGGVLRDLSHELDYITWIFGSWVSISAIGGRLADLTVDSDDSWAIIGELSRAKQFSLQMNYLDTKPTRELRITTSAGTIRVDLIGMEIEANDARITLPGKTADTYVAMHENFLNSDGSVLATLDEGNAVDLLIAVIEESSHKKKWMFAK